MNSIFNNIKDIALKSAFLVLPLCGVGAGLSSCNDWLDVKPNNEQVTSDYWKSKEEVEAVVASGYYQMRNCVPTLIKWGELRGGAMYSTVGTEQKLQDFNMLPTNSMCNYGDLYKVIGYANSVIHYAKGVQGKDDTYYDAILNSHLAEAYFQRAYCYLILVKNFKEVPLVTWAYVDDSQDVKTAKSSEAEILAQIKADCKAALDLGAAKGSYEEEWQTKGRATKWALYALLADASLWGEDYAACKEYCDLILNASTSGDTFYPRFLSNTNNWYDIFYPGNSNESIFELNWDYNKAQETNNFSSSLFGLSGSKMLFTDEAKRLMDKETAEVLLNGVPADGRVGRMLLATYVGTGTSMYLWKYYGNDLADVEGGVRTHQDANFILYRVAEIIMMKAQAEAMLDNNAAAIDLINIIRNRAGLPSKDVNELNTQQEILEEILLQKEMEFMGEAKRWYDVLWLSRVADHKYKQVAVNLICVGNQTTKPEWIKSTLLDDNAWYMPIAQSEIDVNDLLKQNPYYE